MHDAPHEGEAAAISATSGRNELLVFDVHTKLEGLKMTVGAGAGGQVAATEKEESKR